MELDEIPTVEGPQRSVWKESPEKGIIASGDSDKVGSQIVRHMYTVGGTATSSGL